MKVIVVITNHWGPAYGGINSFNTDFCAALAGLEQDRLKIVCVVNTATDEDWNDARRANVELATIPFQATGAIKNSHIVAALQTINVDVNDVICWVGHDILTGFVAFELSRARDQKCAIIRHMDYFSYKCSIGRSINQEEVRNSIDKQRKLTQLSPAYLFAVGPLLKAATRSFQKSSDARSVTCLIPGLADIELKQRPRERFLGITFGRLSENTDPLKQSRLALASFLDAFQDIRGRAHAPLCHFEMIGLPSDISEQDKENNIIKKLSRECSDFWINILAFPFTHDRRGLYDSLSEKHVCLMLSRHEGFGLTGWEAIAAGVPLILSTNSGLFHFLKDQQLSQYVLSYTPLSEIAGRRNNSERTHISDLIKSVSGDIESWLEKAETLKKSLSNFTWEWTAREFLKSCDIDLEEMKGIPVSPRNINYRPGQKKNVRTRGKKGFIEKNIGRKLSSDEQYFCTLISLLRFGLSCSELYAFNANKEFNLFEFCIMLIESGIISDQHGGYYKIHDEYVQDVLSSVSAERKKELYADLSRELKDIAENLIDSGCSGNELLPACEWVVATALAGRMNEAFDFYYHKLQTPLMYRTGKYGISQEILKIFYQNDNIQLPLVSGRGRIMKLHMCFGIVTGCLGNQNQAVLYLNEHNKIAELMKDRTYELSKGHGNLSLLYFSLGNYEKTKYHLKQREKYALDKLERLQTKTGFYQMASLSLAYAWRSFAKLFLAQGLYEESEKMLDKAEQKFDSINNQKGLIRCFIYRGRIRLQKDNDYRQALRLLDQIHDLIYNEDSLKMEDAQDFISYKLLSAELFYISKDLTHAQSEAYEALVYAEKIGCMDMLADCMLAYSQYVMDTDCKSSSEYIEKAYDLSKRSNYRYKLAQSLMLKSLTDRKNSDQHLKEAMKLAGAETPQNQPKPLIDQINLTKRKIKEM